MGGVFPSLGSVGRPPPLGPPCLSSRLSSLSVLPLLVVPCPSHRRHHGCGCLRFRRIWLPVTDSSCRQRRGSLGPLHHLLPMVPTVRHFLPVWFESCDWSKDHGNQRTHSRRCSKSGPPGDDPPLEQGAPVKRNHRPYCFTKPPSGRSINPLLLSFTRYGSSP